MSLLHRMESSSKGLRCVIPLSLRPKIRERLHGAHKGVEGCLRRARETVYWPGMNADLRDYIAKCDVCPTYQKDRLKEALISHKILNHPWETVGCNIFHFEARDYLCTVDYYSSYFEIDQLKCSCLRKCSRGQKWWSTDSAETWHKS